METPAIPAVDLSVHHPAAGASDWIALGFTDTLRGVIPVLRTDDIRQAA